MGTQPIPVDEVERLIDLRALEILDTPAEERFDRITRMAQRLFNVPFALVSLVDEDRQWFKSRIGLEAVETPRELAFCGHAIMGDSVLQITDAANDERFCDNVLVTEEPHIRFYAGAPIESPNGYKMGTLCVLDRKPRKLGKEDLAALRDLADIVEREVAAVQLATTDPLTGLSNRRGFLLVARQVLRFAKRVGKPAGLFFVDIDGMKSINDRWGHDAGDRVLVHTARMLRQCCRESDVVARLGGDEFCVLFSGASTLEAGGAVERLRQAVNEHNRDIEASEAVSLSVGATEWDPASNEPLDELMKRADREMYAQKADSDRRRAS